MRSAEARPFRAESSHFEDPVDILQHLMIGSEGTLGFIAEITYRTVPDHADKASALALFPDLAEACRAVARLKSAPVSAVELMDRAALRSVEGQPGMPTVIAGLDGSAVALLIEVRAGDAAALRADIATVTEALAGFRTLRPAAFSTDAGECAQLWQIRKGLFPAVGARRRTGTTVIIEDVAFPIARLAEATLELQALFARHGYHEAIIFGHALEGNLHFVFTQDFGRGEEVERYRHFMDALCRMVVETYDGSLKAEHGTGRNMAPFVAMEWGTQAYGLMRAIKRLFDPEGLLNPGVILNDDPQAHLKDLKALPAADPLVDTCIECGFCEPQCPSHGLTLSPRQRIVGWRAISRLAASSGSGADRAHETALRRLYDYQGLDTCAACGLCATTCPVGIETGALTKSLRGRRRTGAERRFGAWAARRYGALMTVTGGALTLAGWARRGLGATAVDAIGRTLRRLSGGRLPLWTSAQPTGAHWTPPALVTASDGRPCVVYVPSCASRTMGPAVGDPETTPLPERFAALLAKAGYGVVYPPDLGNLCCGQPFASKGLAAIAAAKAGEMAAAVLRVSENGALPVVLDTSPCALHLKEHLAGDDRLTVHDVTGFIHDHLLGRLDLVKQPGPVLLHATCSTRRMGLDAKLQAIAEACAETVVVPDGIGCCGFAGDKGFTTPELNDHALRHLKAAVPAGCAAGYSTSRTCEIGLSSHAGVPYRSIVDLVEACAAERTSSGRVPNTRAGGPIADATPYRRGAPR